MRKLTPSSFEQCPVWKWDSTEESHEPLEQWQPLSRDEPTLFIAAKFEAADGTCFEGYLVGLDSFYAFGLFVGEREYVLNLNLPDMMEGVLAPICAELGKESVELFPLKYETQVGFEEGEMLSGFLAL